MPKGLSYLMKNEKPKSVIHFLTELRFSYLTKLECQCQRFWEAIFMPFEKKKTKNEKKLTEFYKMGNNEQITALPNGVRH